jgi:hypothetical protein
MHPRRHRLLLAFALALACGRETPPGDVVPLVDDLHAPLVLTESARLEKPPSDSGNRFLRGWWPGSRSAAPSQVSVGHRVVMEAVFLDGRERRLSTDLQILEATPGATFGVQVAGRELPPQPLVPDAEVPLPGGLPLGRLPIELDLRGARVEVHAAGFGHAWPTGELDLAAEAIVQSGYSAIDFPRRLAEPATLVGHFEPPTDPEPDQRFAVMVSTDREWAEPAFEWQPERRGGSPRALRIRLPAGFVRIRLLAQGLGAPARWLDMGIADSGEVHESVLLSRIQGRAGVAYVAASDRYKLIRSPALGLAHDTDTSRDAEYVFDLRRDPSESRNVAGIRAVEVDWLRARLDRWLAQGVTP